MIRISTERPAAKCVKPVHAPACVRNAPPTTSSPPPAAPLLPPSSFHATTHPRPLMPLHRTTCVSTRANRSLRNFFQPRPRLPHVPHASGSQPPSPSKCHFPPAARLLAVSLIQPPPIPPPPPPNPSGTLNSHTRGPCPYAPNLCSAICARVRLHPPSFLPLRFAPPLRSHHPLGRLRLPFFRRAELVPALKVEQNLPCPDARPHPRGKLEAAVEPPVQRVDLLARRGQALPDHRLHIGPDPARNVLRRKGEGFLFLRRRWPGEWEGEGPRVEGLGG